MIKPFLLVAALLICSLCKAAPAYGQRQSYFILPKETDNEITTDLQPHYIALDKSATLKNQIFLFFPGTGGTPAFQQQLLNTAAGLGFHVIGLNYPNDLAVNIDLCVGANSDLDCYAKVRLEIKDGIDRTPLLNITRANSIENRLIKLLILLRSRFPGDGWEQYLENDGAIKWSSVIVSGHSQGGGHAGIIGRYHLVERVVMFAAMDYNGREMKPANWIAVPSSTPNATPAERFYGFSHERDERVNFTVLSSRVWPAYGMNAFGPVTNVDAASPPYDDTHSLTSNLNAPTDNYHGCVAVDRNLALQPDGTPVYKPVWEYLLSNATKPTAPTISSLQILKKGKPVDRLAAGAKANKYRINLKGSGFVSGSKALISGIEAETRLDINNELEIKLPFERVPDVETITVQVRNADGQTSNALTIEVRRF